MSVATADVEINASAERVWQIISDFPRYSQWNPLVPRLKCEQRVGARGRGLLGTGGKLSVPFFPKIVAFEPNSELGWVGEAPIPGLFKGDHRFFIEPLGENSCRLRHREEFTGFFANLLGERVVKLACSMYVEYNRELKLRAEKSA